MLELKSSTVTREAILLVEERGRGVANRRTSLGRLVGREEPGGVEPVHAWSELYLRRVLVI